MCSSDLTSLSVLAYPPSGVVNIGRVGDDLSASYFPVYSTYSLSPSDLEFFIPSTSTVVSYDGNLQEPYTFPAVTGAFSGDYTLEIRVVSTGEILDSITVPDGENQDIPFNV